jgi:hypothetical protein
MRNDINIGVILSRYRGYTNKILRVLVNIYFYRGLSGKNQRRSTYQIYIERNRPYYKKEYSKRLEKIPRRGGPTG